LSEEEKKLFGLYGKLPTHKSVLTKMQKVQNSLCSLTRLTTVQDRKYFDSGDYAMSKAGVAPQSNVGTTIPNPEK
jgi:cAMP-regulated phosphoprotein/endosulfine conserved region